MLGATAVGVLDGVAVGGAVRVGVGNLVEIAIDVRVGLGETFVVCACDMDGKRNIDGRRNRTPEMSPAFRQCLLGSVGIFIPRNAPDHEIREMRAYWQRAGKFGRRPVLLALVTFHGRRPHS